MNLDPTIPNTILSALNELSQAANAAAAATDLANGKSAASLQAQHDSDTAVAMAQTAAQQEAQKLTQLQSLLSQTYGPPTAA